ncbi:hypothetical protein FJZ19_06220 [Candidatus Pacearchaeota archaeon]|nr:hypothetical protein [Candidatus Pacearchaeota archaeon]
MVDKTYIPYDHFILGSGMDIRLFSHDLEGQGFQVLEHTRQEVKSGSLPSRALKCLASIFVYKSTKFQQVNTLKVARNGRESTLVLHCDYFQSRLFEDVAPHCPTFVRSIEVHAEEDSLRDLSLFFQGQRFPGAGYKEAAA